MSTQDDVRRVALSLPATSEDPGPFRFLVDGRAFVTEPHYDGYPAVLVRLAVVEVELLASLAADAWRSRAPRRLLRAVDRTEEGPE